MDERLALTIRSKKHVTPDLGGCSDNRPMSTEQPFALGAASIVRDNKPTNDLWLKHKKWGRWPHFPVFSDLLA
ncbi:MAG: hypothetical protein BM558_04220 [Roseobacter sp. MedPE-SW]|nr:MAG: hypothetical protein BM558_04220 [Roseobacter sp. MedPE-SW]